MVRMILLNNKTIYYLIVFSVFVLQTNDIYGQGRIESRSGINYGFEFFEYEFTVNKDYTAACSSPLDQSLLKVPVFDMFYISYNGILALGGAAGIRWGLMDEYFKVYQVNVDIFFGFGTRYFDIYLGGRGRVWYNLQQKAFNIVNAEEEYVAMRGDDIALNYAALGGVRVYVLRVFTITIELIQNYYTVNVYESNHNRNTIPAYSTVSFSPIGLKISLGLNIFE